MSGLRRLLAGSLAAAATLAGIFILGLTAALMVYNSPGPKAVQGEATTVVLRSGAGLSEISGALSRAQVIHSGALFTAMAQGTGAARQLKAGEYEFNSRASMAQVLGKIRRGEVVRHFVTIPEGMTSEMAMEVLARQDILIGYSPVPPEGSLLPETYEIVRGEERSAVLGRMMAARDELVARLWDGRAQGLPFNSPDEAVTLASIVEKETALKTERPRIARVFVNRLQKGMRLESDPTIIYDVSGGRPLGRGIRASELAAATPHNTYLIDGLPPTPITNPGREALAAVLNPPPGNDLFFVANGTGGHVFAQTFEEHSRNVGRWRQIEAGQSTAPAPKAAPRKGRR